MPGIDRRCAVSRRLILVLLVVVNSIMCCVSLVWLAPYDEFHIFYHNAQLPTALLSVAAFSLVSLLSSSPISASATLSASTSIW
jgi:hypothetical protein